MKTHEGAEMASDSFAPGDSHTSTIELRSFLSHPHDVKERKPYLATGDPSVAALFTEKRVGSVEVDALVLEARSSDNRLSKLGSFDKHWGKGR